MPLYLWSTTAGSNATADPSINWAEGQPPASVNDSARAMMAVLKEWTNDLSAFNTTAGTSSAYTLATQSVFDTLAHANGNLVGFIPHATNAINPTINIDGLGNLPIRSSPGVSIGAGVLVQGTPYAGVVISATSEFILRGFYGNAFNVPVGGFMPFVSTTPPNSNFVLPSGQAISRTTYAALFALTGTTWGTGDGVTTFNIPDLRGRAVFGLDNMNGSAANRITVAGGNWDGTVLEATARGGQNETVAQANLPNVNFAVSGITLSDPGHHHTFTGNTATNTATSAGAGNRIDPTSGTVTTSNATTGITISSQGSAASGGSGTPLPIMPPALVLPFILRVI